MKSLALVRSALLKDTRRALGGEWLGFGKGCAGRFMTGEEVETGR